MKAWHVSIPLAYLAVGVAVAAWTAQLGQDGKPAFRGFVAFPGAAQGVLATVLAWPWAVYVNLSQK